MTYVYIRQHKKRTFNRAEETNAVGDNVDWLIIDRVLDTVTHPRLSAFALDLHQAQACKQLVQLLTPVHIFHTNWR